MKNILFVLVITLISCKSIKKNNTMSGFPMSIEISDFGSTKDGQIAKLYKLKNENGMEVSITDFGGVIVGLTAPDRDGNFEDVVLGMESIAPYQGDVPYFGAIIGRFGNRIAGSKFTLDGEEFTIGSNLRSNALHGGDIGFDKVFWDVQSQTGSEPSLVLSYLSKDGEEGFPGNLNVVVTYSLSKYNALRIDYKATTDKPTVVNLTNHSYFNLSAMKESVLSHELQMDASAYLPTNRGIPTGELKDVEGGPFDFMVAKSIDQNIDSVGRGYDHNYILDDKSEGMKRVGSVYHEGSGRVMEVQTTEPGVQLYTGNWLDGSLIGKNSISYARHFGICLETQHYPDSPNQPAFPTTRLNPGEVYESSTVYAFSTK